MSAGEELQLCMGETLASPGNRELGVDSILLGEIKMIFLIPEYWMIANAYPPRAYQRADSPLPAVLGSAAQSGGDNMLWEAKLVTFPSP